MKNKKEEKPLTLPDLAQYTQKILLPAIEKRLEGFVTKKDAEKFATKADLRIMELDLREEIKNCVTKEEFNKRFDQVMISLDKVIKNQEDWRQENIDKTFIDQTHHLGSSNRTDKAFKILPFKRKKCFCSVP